MRGAAFVMTGMSIVAMTGWNYGAGANRLPRQNLQYRVASDRLGMTPTAWDVTIGCGYIRTNRIDLSSVGPNLCAVEAHREEGLVSAPVAITCLQWCLEQK